MFFLLKISPSVAIYSITFSYFSEYVTVDIDEHLRVTNSISNKEELEEYYQYLESQNFQVTLDDILHFHKEMKLNDWLYYKLLIRLSETISLSEKVLVGEKNNVVPFVSFFLNKYGFDTQIDFYNGEKFLYVYSEDTVYLPTVVEDKRRYICLNYDEKPGFKLYRSSKFYNKIDNKKPFSFSFKSLPNFPNGRKSISPTFFFNGSEYTTFHPIHNESIIMSLEDYPTLKMGLYLDIPLTKGVYDSLIVPLKEKIKDKNEEETISLLLEFVRNNFIYVDDSVLFKRDKWLTVYESLYYGALDCEDRSILFGYLIKEILNLPIILISYNVPQHTNVGVALPAADKGLMYKGIHYAVCETTPTNEPMGENTLYKQYKYEIFGSYFPDIDNEK